MKFTIIYHNFGGYFLELTSINVPIEFVICSVTVIADSFEEAKQKALGIFIDQGHINLITARTKYNYQH